MDKGITFRREIESDNAAANLLIRTAFWNVSVPGCDEHYLAHKMRTHVDYLSDLSLVAIKDGEIVGCIMYTKSKIVSADGNFIDTITFGPVAVHPNFQAMGVGSAMIKYSLVLARELGHKAVVIFGYPRYYGRLGFRCGEKYDITTEEGAFAPSLMVYILQKGVFDNISGHFEESSVFHDLPEEEVALFDQGFPPAEKLEDTKSQREFQVLINLSYKCIDTPV